MVLAAQQNNIGIVKDLVANGAQAALNYKDARIGDIARNQEILAFLIQKGVLHKFAPEAFLALKQIQGEPTIIRDICSRTRSLCDPDKTGMDAISLAAAAGLQTLVETLVRKGCDVNGATGGTATPLYRALRHHRKATALFLIGAGADVCKTNRVDGQSPLHAAVELDAGMVALLIGKGAPVNQRDRDGRTPLHMAYSLRGPAGARSIIIDALLTHGADPEIKDSKGIIPARMPVSKPMITHVDISSVLAREDEID